MDMVFDIVSKKGHPWTAVFKNMFRQCLMQLFSYIIIVLARR